MEKTWEYSLEALTRGIANKVTPGLAAGVSIIKPGHVERKIFTLGSLGYGEPYLEKVSPETIYDLSSLTKPLSTAALFFRLRERGWIHEDELLKKYFPDTKHSKVTIGQILSHCAGFAACTPFWKEVVSLKSTRDRRQFFIDKINTEELAYTPGSQVLYSDLGMILLGFIFEQILDKPLDTFFSETFGCSLSHRDLNKKIGFVRNGEESPKSLRNFAPTEYQEWRGGIVVGEVHDENAWALGGVAGHSGLFGTIDSVLHVSEKCVRGGFYGSESLRLMRKKVRSGNATERTLGWDTPSDGPTTAGRFFSKTSIGHLGFTGTSVWIDWDCSPQVIGVLLTNRVHPSRENKEGIRDLRVSFYEAIKKDLSIGFQDA